MGRPRTTNSHLPKYVTVRGPSYWYGPTGQKPVRICAVGDFQNLYKFLADKMEPSREARTIGDLFDRYIREELPKLAEQTQHGYLDHLTKLRAWCGGTPPSATHACRSSATSARSALGTSRTMSLMRCVQPSLRRCGSQWILRC